MAVKKTFVPCAMLPFPGWIEIELRSLASTVTEVLAELDSKDAEMVAVPTPLAVTKPLCVIEAIAEDEELHFATPVTFC